MSEKFYIGGKHPVLSAIQNPKRIVHEVHIATKSENINFRNIKIVDKRFFNKIFKNKDFNHQNISALVSPLKTFSLKEEINKKSINNVVILNGISDPRNIGSILRSSLAFGFEHIIVEKKYYDQRNPIIVKSSSGSIEFLKILPVSNIKNEIKILKKNNFNIIGIDSNSKKDINNLSNFNNNALIFGSEGEGIQKSVLEICDDTFKISINKKIDSLNVSNAVSATLAILKYKM